MVKLKRIKKFLCCVYILWCMPISIIEFVARWVFVAVSAVLDFLIFDFKFSLTKDWASEMQTPKEFYKELKYTINLFFQTIKS